MLQEAILKFRSSGPILLPAIIDNYTGLNTKCGMNEM